eukprot:SAG22_NODE_436_length_10519_cov_21.912188_14_plen_75_part_00
MVKGEKVGRDIILLYFHRDDSVKSWSRGVWWGKKLASLKIGVLGKMGFFGKGRPLVKMEGFVDFGDLLGMFCPQ